MRLKTLGILLYGLLSIALVSVVYAVFTVGFHNLPKATLEDMIYGRASRPFVYRALAPAVVRLIVAAVPAPLHDQINRDVAQNATVQRAFPIFHWSTAYGLEYFVALLLMFVLLAALIPAMAYLIRSVFRASPRFTAIVSLLGIVGLPVFMNKRFTNYIYDLPTLILFTLGLALWARQRWRLYFLVFVLACINKETALLLTMVCAIHFRARWRKYSFWRFLAAQTIVYGLIKGVLTLMFNGNPGVINEFSLDHNLELFRAITPLAPALLLGLALLLFYHWHDKPRFLKDALWMLVPLFGFGLFFGFLDEIRIFYEVYPVVLLLAAHSIATFFRANVTALPEPRTAPDQTPRRASVQTLAASDPSG